MKNFVHEAFEGNALSLAIFDSSMLECQSIGGRFEHFSPMPQQLTLQVLGGPLTDSPITTVELLALVLTS